MKCRLYIEVSSAPKVPINYFDIPGEFLLRDNQALFLGWKRIYKGNDVEPVFIELRLSQTTLRSVEKDQLEVYGPMRGLTHASDDLFRPGSYLRCATWKVKPRGSTERRTPPLNEREERLWLGRRVGAKETSRVVGRVSPPVTKEEYLASLPKDLPKYRIERLVREDIDWHDEMNED